MSFSWPDEISVGEDDIAGAVEVFESAGFPPPAHTAEADLFVRQYGVPGHNQDCLSAARVLVVGAGGLGSWTALMLARSGVRKLRVVDFDRFDRTNAHRQLMYAGDLQRRKAIAVARSVVGHMIAGGQVTAIPISFENAIERFPLPADLVLFLVDNNRTRFEGIRFARERRIPAVFTMLSRDGSRLQSFLQGSNQDDPCLHCALPNLDVSASAPCASATITSCLLAAAYTTFFAHRAVMGWPPDVPPFNWRDADLFGAARVGTVKRRRDCPMCSSLK